MSSKFTKPTIEYCLYLHDPSRRDQRTTSRCEAYSIQFIDERKTQGDLNKEDEEEGDEHDENH